MKKITDEKVHVLHDGPSDKYIPCLYDKNGNFLTKGTIKWTGNKDLTPNASYLTYETTIYFTGYEPIKRKVVIR